MSPALYWLISAVAVGMAADEGTAKRPELCTLKTVALAGDEEAVKEARKRIEKTTWLKKASSPDSADAILDARIFVTSLNMTFASDRVTSGKREGHVELKLKRRQPDEVLWEDKRPLDVGKPENLGMDALKFEVSKPVDLLLSALQSQAGCPMR